MNQKTADSVLFIGFDRPVSGREEAVLTLVSDTIAYLERQQAAGQIESFELVSLSPHGGNLNEFVLIRGEQAKLDALRSRDEFEELVFKGYLYAHGMGIINGVIGERLRNRMGRSTEFLKGIS